jgi:hypothetical protein
VLVMKAICQISMNPLGVNDTGTRVFVAFCS